MPLRRFEEILAGIEGVEAVALGGGEPTLHPELPRLLSAARRMGLPAGLTTNASHPTLVASLADSGLLASFGVSAGKGEWLALAGHPRATVNLLLLGGGLPELARSAAQALRAGARRLMLLGYKGSRRAFSASDRETQDAFAVLGQLGRASGAQVAADDYTRRRLGLIETCGEGFVRVSIEGEADRCCFPECEYRG